MSEDQARLRYWSIEVFPAGEAVDGHGNEMLADIRRTGVTGVFQVCSSRVYMLEGGLRERDVRGLGGDLLADPVSERWRVFRGLAEREIEGPSVEVHPLPGVMSPVAQSTLSAVRRWLRFRGSPESHIGAVKVARRYRIQGAAGAEELERIAGKVLANVCIEQGYVQGLGRNDSLPTTLPVPPQRPFCVRHVSLSTLDEDGLRRLSREGHLFLSLEEMEAIRNHYRALKRDPTDLELETFAQTWSEHCVHKTLKSAMVYRGDDFGRSGRVEVRFENLLKDTIVAATQELNRAWCLSVFVDNAGVIAFDDEFGVAFKVETHNHPSAIEPYGGAATGVGGCIRDVMGCGLGAKPIASTDVFCLAPPEFDSRRIPHDVLHPRRVLKGVVGGVRDYGNRMGIPTVNGAIYFDERYLANPLVFCGCVGLIPRKFVSKQVHAGDRIVVAGGRTGRDGLHGATFSSAELTSSHADEFAHAVQIGNAIEEKKLLDALLRARDDEGGCLFSSVTDCGAGGLSSAIGEMAEKIGAMVELEKVPLKYSGLRYDEIWISEAQERMVFAVAPGRLQRFLELFEAEEVETAVLGTFTGDGVLEIRFQGQVVGKMDVEFLHGGRPRRELQATWNAKTWHAEQKIRTRDNNGAARDGDLAARLLEAMADLNVASKEWAIRQYDHEVQSRSVIKPIVGPGAGPGDAAVLRPRLDSYRGIAVGCGLCPSKADDDPYWMAIEAVDEALRNVTCVGGDPDHTAILDNFCWPKVDTAESLGALVRACRGAADAAVAYGLPFISGKDSLNNEFVMDEAEAARTGLPQQLAIPPTLLISAISVLSDVRRCVSMDLKEAGNVIVLASAPVREAGLLTANAMHRRVAELIASGKVRSAHDVSDGGLAVAVAEMCIAGEIGASILVDPVMYTWDLFENAPTTYVLEMDSVAAKEVGWPIIGRAEEDRRFRVWHPTAGKADVAVDDLAAAWRRPLGAPAGT